MKAFIWIHLTNQFWQMRGNLKVAKHLMIVFAVEFIIFIMIFNCQKSSYLKD